MARPFPPEKGRVCVCGGCFACAALRVLVETGSVFGVLAPRMFQFGPPISLHTLLGFPSDGYYFLKSKHRKEPLLQRSSTTCCFSERLERTSTERVAYRLFVPLRLSRAPQSQEGLLDANSTS